MQVNRTLSSLGLGGNDLEGAGRRSDWRGIEGDVALCVNGGDLSNAGEPSAHSPASTWCTPSWVLAALQRLATCSRSRVAWRFKQMQVNRTLTTISLALSHVFAGGAVATAEALKATVQLCDIQ